MAFCAKCGNQLSGTAAFCTKCGTARALSEVAGATTLMRTAQPEVMRAALPPRTVLMVRQKSSGLAAVLSGQGWDKFTPARSLKPS
jgi:uncharacterized membrane protein YvbJ